MGLRLFGLARLAELLESLEGYCWFVDVLRLIWDFLINLVVLGWGS